MAGRKDLMVAEQGLSIDNLVDFLYGTAAPGGTTLTDDAGIGSLYSEVTGGGIWKKVFSGTGADKWSELITNELPITVANVTSQVLFDQIPTASSNYFVWGFSAYATGDETQRISGMITASNNATSAADATEVKFEVHSKLKHGTIAGFLPSVVLNMNNSVQQMSIGFQSTTPVTVTLYRILKDYTSTHTIGSVQAQQPPYDPINNQPASATYTYNVDGTVASVPEVINGLTQTTTYTYNADGTVHTVVLAYNGKTRTETYVYNPDGTVASMVAIVV